MSNLKRISAVALCAAVAASFSGCGNNIAGADTTYGAVIDGVKIPAGVFISMQKPRRPKPRLLPKQRMIPKKKRRPLPLLSPTRLSRARK
jgi:hypothetical protein